MLPLFFILFFFNTLSFPSSVRHVESVYTYTLSLAMPNLGHRILNSDAIRLKLAVSASEIFLCAIKKKKNSYTDSDF